jgi:hypothetical protein
VASGGKLYSVYSGRREIGVRKAWSGGEAVIEYLITMGCRSDEMHRLGPDSVVWRGATYKALPVVVDEAA